MGFLSYGGHMLYFWCSSVLQHSFSTISQCFRLLHVPLLQLKGFPSLSIDRDSPWHQMRRRGSLESGSVSSGSMHMQVALPFLHEHELPEAVRFEMQQEEEAQKASGAHSWSTQQQYRHPVAWTLAHCGPNVALVPHAEQYTCYCWGILMSMCPLSPQKALSQ